VRIASLVPSATETLFALGLGDRVVAVTHECDFPDAATRLPRLTRSVIAEDLAPAEIDRAVREVTGRGEALYELDEAALRDLDVDLIVTQAVCAVCAVSYDDVCAVAGRLPTAPRVVSQDPSTLTEVLDEVERLGREADAEAAGVTLRRSLDRRLGAVAERASPSAPPGGGAQGRARARVVALEWLDPPYVGGHWVPEMIALAGGDDPLASPGERSRVASWDELRGARPDVVVVMPCGLYADEAREQALAHATQLGSLGADSVVAVDAASTFSRPGPRLVDGVELLGHLLRPGAVPAPNGIGFHALELAASPAPAP
jgi:iron complex transport system substrate-binding protein